jgi:hypothetical protein
LHATPPCIQVVVEFEFDRGIAGDKQRQNGKTNTARGAPRAETRQECLALEEDYFSPLVSKYGTRPRGNPVGDPAEVPKPDRSLPESLRKILQTLVNF